MLTLNRVKYRHVNSAQPYDFSLTAKPGDVVCIMGESGSGKSTLLDLIAGFLQPESGTIKWDGNDLTTLPPEKRPISILFQNNNLFEHLTAEQNVAIGINPAWRISTEDREHVSDALQSVGLAGKKSQRVSSLSGGQRQRVALARSIVGKNPISLLDEPFNGLDDETKSTMLTLVQDEAVKHRKCVLMVTHDLSDAEEIATQKYIIHDNFIKGISVK